MKMGSLTVGEPSVVSVFSATGLNECPLDDAITYQRVESDDDHGVFDVTTGLFTAATAGLYLFFFDGTSWQSNTGPFKGPTLVEMRVNDQVKATTECNCSHKINKEQIGFNLSISAMMRLNRGDVLGLYTTEGSLSKCSDGPDSNTRFWSIFLRE